MNTKECHENAVGHLQNKYNKKVNHHDSVVDKLITKYSQKKMNTMEHHDKVACKLKTKYSKIYNNMYEGHVKVIGQLHSHR